MANTKLYILLSLCTVLAFSSCKKKIQLPEEPLAARVFDKVLTQADVAKVHRRGASSEDSTAIVHSYIDKWVRDELMLDLAEDQMDRDDEIEELVEDYRATLIRHRFEQIIIEDRLDSLIEETEMLAYYEKHKEQYPLENTIVRCYLIKLPRNTPDLNNFKRWWREREALDYDNMMKYCNEHAELFMLDDKTWYKFDDISDLLPKNALYLKSLRSGKEVVVKEGSYRYFVRIHEVAFRKKPAPLSYGEIQKSITKIILNQRKTKLLQDVSNELYMQETNKNNVEIY